MALDSKIDKNALKEPWFPLDPKEAASFEAELRRETTSGHELYKVVVQAVARRLDQDDVCYLHAKGVYVVHLTFSAKEQSPYPLTEHHASWNCFIQDRVNPDFAEWSD